MDDTLEDTNHAGLKSSPWQYSVFQPCARNLILVVESSKAQTSIVELRKSWRNPLIGLPSSPDIITRADIVSQASKSGNEPMHLRGVDCSSQILNPRVSVAFNASVKDCIDLVPRKKDFLYFFFHRHFWEADIRTESSTAKMPSLGGNTNTGGSIHAPGMKETGLPLSKRGRNRECITTKY